MNELMISVIVPGLLDIFAFKDIINEVASASLSTVTIGLRKSRLYLRSEGHDSKRMEMIDRSRALPKIYGHADSGINVATGVSDGSADRLAVRKIASDGG